jgi:serine/threonine protein kinase
MPCTGTKFKPLPNETLVLKKQTYTVRPHPMAPTSPLAAEGRRAVVISLQDVDGAKWALKVFRKAFRVSSLVGSATLVGRYQYLPGMIAARRSVIEPKDEAAVECPDLAYSTLMPWIEGTTWFDMLLKMAEYRRKYDLRASLRICGTFLKVMDGLEQAGVTHTDIAPGNVSVNLKTFDVQLLDLEDIYVADAPEPKVKNTGSSGYRHPSADDGKTTWCAEGDRYATAVMAAEMLLLASPDVDSQSSDGGLFGGDRTTTTGTQRFNATYPYLQSVAPDFAELFRLAWMSDDFEACPTASQLASAIAKVPLPAYQPPPHWLEWVEIPDDKNTAHSQPQGPNGNGSVWVVDTTPPPPTPPPPTPKPKRISGFQWALIVIGSILLLGALVWAFVAASHSTQQHTRLTPEQRDLQRFTDYTQWLNDRKVQMSPKVIVKVKNECARDPIREAIRFKPPDDSGRRLTLRWWSVPPGNSVFPAMATTNRVVYLHAENSDATRNRWHQVSSAPAKVLDYQFFLQYGDDVSRESPSEVPMFRRDLNKWASMNSV